MHSVLILAFIVSLSKALPEIEKSKKSEHVQCKWKPNKNPSNERVSYLGAQLWKVTLDTEEKSNLVETLENIEELEDWGLNDKTYYDVFVKPRYVKSVSKKFNDNNITYTIVTDNFQKWINEENPPTNESHAGHNLTWAKYHRLADIESFIDYLAATYPNLCSVKTIGSSIEGRPLRVLKISSGRPRRKAIWVDGGIHAREWISVATVTYTMRHLVENWENETNAVRNIDWYFLPVLNPDGYEFAHTHDRLWRKNRRQNGTCPGTDLNRNFQIKWGGPGASNCPCHEVYAGSAPFSEPESIAVKNYITVTEQKTLWKAFITFHSYGQIIFHPRGNDLKRVGEKMVEEMRSVSGTIYTIASPDSDSDATSGSSDDWAKKVAGIKYAYTLELRDLGQYGFVLPAFNIKPSGEEGLAALRVIANSINIS